MTAGHDGAGDLASALEALAARLDVGSAGEGAVAEVVVASDLQVHPDALDDLSLDPRATTAALVSYQSSGDIRSGSRADVRTSGGRIVSASSSVHRAAAGDGEFTGALRVAPADRRRGRRVGPPGRRRRPRPGLGGRPRRPPARRPRARRDPRRHRVARPVAVAEGRHRSGRRGLPPTSSRASTATGRTRLRLARARKADDGAWATVVSRPLSRWFTPQVLRLGLDAEPGDGRVLRDRARRGGRLRHRRPGPSRRGCTAAAAVPGPGLRRRRRGPLPPRVQLHRCLAGRLDRPDQGVRLLRRAGRRVRRRRRGLAGWRRRC